MNTEIKTVAELKKAIRKCRRVLVFALFCERSDSWVIIAKKEAMNLLSSTTDAELARHPAEYDSDQNVVYLRNCP